MLVGLCRRKANIDEHQSIPTFHGARLMIHTARRTVPASFCQADILKLRHRYRYIFKNPVFRISHFLLPLHLLKNNNTFHLVAHSRSPKVTSYKEDIVKEETDKTSK